MADTATLTEYNRVGVAMADYGEDMEEELVDFSGSEYEFDADLVMEEEEDAPTSIRNEALHAKNVIAGKSGGDLERVQESEKDNLDQVSRVNFTPSDNRCEQPPSPVGENVKNSREDDHPAQQSAGETVDRKAAATADLEDGEYEDKASLRASGNAWTAPTHAKAKSSGGDVSSARAGVRPVERGHKEGERGNRRKDEEVERTEPSDRRTRSDLDRGKRNQEREVEQEEPVKRPRSSPNAGGPITNMLGNLAGVRMLPQDLLRLQGQQGLVGLMGRPPMLPLGMQRGLRAGAFPFGQLPGVVRKAGIQELLAREKLAARTQQHVRNMQLEGQPMRPPPPPQHPLPGREYFPTHPPPPRRNERAGPAAQDSRPMGLSRAAHGRNDGGDGRKGGGPGDGLLGANPILSSGPLMSSSSGLGMQEGRGGGKYQGRRDVEASRGERWGEERERERGGKGEERRVVSGRGEERGRRMSVEESRGVVLYAEGERRKEGGVDRRVEDGRDGRHEAGVGAGRGPLRLGREGVRGPVLRDGREMAVPDRVVMMGRERLGPPPVERMGREERGVGRVMVGDSYREAQGRLSAGNNDREEGRRRDGERGGFDEDRGWGRPSRDISRDGQISASSYDNRGTGNVTPRKDEHYLRDPIPRDHERALLAFKSSPPPTWGSVEASRRLPGGGPGRGRGRGNEDIQTGPTLRIIRVAEAKEHRGEWGGGDWGGDDHRAKKAVSVGRRSASAERPPRSPDLHFVPGSARTDMLRYSKEGEERNVRERSRDRVTKFSPPTVPLTLQPRSVPPPPRTDARYPEGGGVGPVRERQRKETQFSAPPPGPGRFSHPPQPIPSPEVPVGRPWLGERVSHSVGGPRDERLERGLGFSGRFTSGPPAAELARMRDEGGGRGGGAGVMSGVRHGVQEADRPRPRSGFPSPLPPPPHSMPRFIPQEPPPGPSGPREWEREDGGGERGRGRGRGGVGGGGDGRDERDGGRMAHVGGRPDPIRMHDFREPRKPFQGGKFSHITPALRPTMPHERFTDPNLKGRRLM